MIRHRLYQCLLVLLAVGLIAGGASFQRPIDDLRREMDRLSGEDVTEPSVELRLKQAVPGVFTAVALNYLWIHSETQKSRGQYYDAEYTSEQICELMVRFPAVWANRAWNLAYNISVKHYTGDDRWALVQQGVRLLRNEGLRWNPKSLPLYLELAWIYQHKLGQVMDDMHETYKRYHAGEFHRVLGAPPPRGGDDYALRYRQWLQPMADAPAPKDAAALAADPAVAALVGQLEALNVEPGLRLLDAYNTWSDDPLVRQLLQPIAVPANERETRLQRLMTDPALDGPRRALVAFSRRKVLWEQYRMKPEWMLHITDHYGPVDWRVVWAHSLYWSSYGLYHVKGVDVTDLDPINTGRHVIESLKNLAMYGHITLWYNPDKPAKPDFNYSTDWRFIEVCHQTHLSLGQYYSEGEAREDQTIWVYHAGHENFLRLAVQVLYFAGRIDEADRYMAYLRRIYGQGNPLYNLDLEQFVWYLFEEHGMTQRAAVNLMVTEMVYQAFLNLAGGRRDTFQFQMQRAQYFWRAWHNLTGYDTRKQLDDFSRLAGLCAIRALAEAADPLIAMDVWQLLPDEGQRAAYDPLRAMFRETWQRDGIDFDKSFPEPPGMAEFRLQDLERRRQRVTPGSETD
ncbi:MAG: hypothetical protein GX591_11470, partial [Planctomycetes bacterium]|nr:hypothetical protein [Planctomycetota bacterium]